MTPPLAYKRKRTPCDKWEQDEYGLPSMFCIRCGCTRGQHDKADRRGELNSNGD